jgi:quercetin dioxygenase-like cupin family protein
MRTIKLITLCISALALCLAADQGYAPAISIRTLMKTSVDSAGQPIQYPQKDPEITGVLVEIPGGQNTGWHTHSSPSVEYILSGEVTVEFENGTTKHLKAGDTYVECVNVVHRGLNRSTNAARIVMFVIGQKGQPISQRVEK